MRAKDTMVDYYAVLNLPHGAPLDGVENAYARLASELAAYGQVDEACRAQLVKLNEAYGVLSRPELRRAYDEVFLARERTDRERAAWSAYRRRTGMQWAIIGVLAAILAAQGAAIMFIGWDELQPLWPF